MRCRAIALTAVAAVALGACQRADERASDTGATTLTVYASLPLQGPAGPDSQAVANGVRLALREAGGKAGELVVKLVVLDDSTPGTGRWDPRQTAENARTVVRDRTAIAYVGDGPSGATAISLPILNAAGIPQVSPTSTYQGLTQAEGGDKGEPEKYYPAGTRTFARPVPDDRIQARALLSAMRERGCRRLQLLEERDLAGRGLALAVEAAALAGGIEVLGRDAVRADDDPAREAERVAERGADCALFAGALSDWVPRLYDALHAASPRLELFGGNELASDAFAAALGAGTQARTQVTAVPGVLEPLPGVRAFAERYEEAFWEPARTGAIYGFEAMRLVLAAIRSAGARGNDRAAVGRALLGTPERPGVLGPYGIDERGDTTNARYSLLAARDGRLVRRRTGSFPG